MKKQELDIIRQEVQFKKRLYFRGKTLVDRLENEIFADLIVPPTLIQTEDYREKSRDYEHLIHLKVDGSLRRRLDAWGDLYARDYGSYLKPEFLENPGYQRVDRTIGAQSLVTPEEIRLYIQKLSANSSRAFLSPEEINRVIRPEALDKLEGTVFLSANDFCYIYPDAEGKDLMETRAIFEAATGRPKESDYFLLGEEHIHTGLQANTKPWYFPVQYFKSKSD